MYKPLFCIFLFLMQNSTVGKNTLYVASKTRKTESSKPNRTWDYHCDGTDDDIEIQAALNQLRGKGGGRVILSDGVFSLTKNVHIYSSDTTFSGAGRDKTILKLVDNAPRFIHAGFITSYKQRNIAIRDMTLDGNRKNQPKDETLKGKNYGKFGVYTEVCNNTLMTNLHVKDFWGYGLDPHGKHDTYWTGKVLTITNNLITDCGFDGITIDKQKYTVVSGNTVIRSGRHGINVVTGSRFTDIRNNILIDNGYEDNGCGICFGNNFGYGTKYGLIFQNHITNSKSAGICLWESTQIRIQNNTMRNSKTCIRTKDVKYLHIDQDNSCDGETALVADDVYIGGKITMKPIE